jgi:ketosteroid isomerase-like protein
MSEGSSTQLVQEFTDAMTTDDVDTMVRLFHDDSEVEWVIMATGETFRGPAGIRKLAERSVASRAHSEQMGIKPTHVFANPEGTELCWEYVHQGIVTENWPSSSPNRPAPGSAFELPIVLVCDIREGKVLRIREYFDLGTLLEGGAKHRLYA